MASAKFSRWVFAAGCALSLVLAACGGKGAVNVAESTPATPGGDAIVAATAPPAGDDGGDTVAEATPTTESQVPESVPLLDTAFDLAVTSDGSYIAYKAPESFDATVTFYQTALEEAGWEKINSKDAAFGGSTTLLRARPEATISVTIQAVPGDDNAVRVLISYTKK